MIKQYNQYIYKDGQWLLVGVSDQNNFITYVLQKDGDTITLKGDDNSTSDVVIKEFSDEAKAKLENIAAGAQVNVLEGVKVNGTKLTIDGEKLVDISVPTKLSQLTNDADYVTDANYVHTDNNYTTAEKNKLAGIAASADVNTIEQIKVNNSALTPDGNKIVNITVPTKLTDLTNDNNFVTDANYVHTDNNYTTAEKNKLAGLSNYDDTEIKQQIAQAGKIDTIKVNGTAQPVVDKTVSLTIPTVPTNISAFTNDKNYQTEDEVTSLIADAVGEIQTLEYNVVGSLPTTGETGVIYLVSNGGTNPNIYDEYIYINGNFEKIGTTEIDLSGYLTKTEAGETYARKAEVAQSDWEQNDETAADYIKNRPFYEENRGIKTYLTTTSEATAGQTVGERSIFYLDDYLGEGVSIPQIGSELTVDYNGTTYTLIAEDVGNAIPQYSNMGIMLGNPSLGTGLFTSETKEDNGLPFLFMGIQAGNSIQTVMVAKEQVISSFSISGEDIFLKQIDKKFVPFDLPLEAGSQMGSVRHTSSTPENENYTIGALSFALGMSSKAPGMMATTFGAYTEANDIGAFATGRDTFANGGGSHTEGTYTFADGNNSHAEGSWSVAADGAAHAEGSSTAAIGQGAHAEGYAGETGYISPFRDISSSDYLYIPMPYISEHGSWSPHTFTQLALEVAPPKGVLAGTAWFDANDPTGYVRLVTIPCNESKFKGKTLYVTCSIGPSSSSADTQTYTPKYCVGICNEDGTSSTQLFETTEFGTLQSFQMPSSISDGQYYFYIDIYGDTNGELTERVGLKVYDFYIGGENALPASKEAWIDVDYLDKWSGYRTALVKHYVVGNHAIGDATHVEGKSTISVSDNQHVQGKYNEIDWNNKYAHIVGNGTGPNDRSNAHTVDWDGNAYYAGKVTVGTDPVDAMDVVTKQYLENNSSSYEELSIDFTNGEEYHGSGNSDVAYHTMDSAIFNNILEQLNITTGVAKEGIVLVKPITHNEEHAFCDYEIPPILATYKYYYSGVNQTGWWLDIEGNIEGMGHDPGETVTRAICISGGENLYDNSIWFRADWVLYDNVFAQLNYKPLKTYGSYKVVEEWTPGEQYYYSTLVSKDGMTYKALDDFTEEYNLQDGDYQMSPVRGSIAEVTPTEGMQIRGEGVIRPDCSFFESISNADLFNYITASGFTIPASEAIEDDIEMGVDLTTLPYNFHKIFDSSMGRVVHMISSSEDDLQDIILCIPNEYITESGKISVSIFLNEGVLASYVFYMIVMGNIVLDENGQFVSGGRMTTGNVQRMYNISFKTNDFVVDTITSVSDHFSDTFKVLKAVQNPKWELLHTHFIDGQFNDDEIIKYYDNILNKEDNEYETARTNVKPGSIIFNTKGGYKNVHFSIYLGGIG